MKHTLILSALLLGSFTPLHAGEFFVSPSGNDSNPGTEAKPFATLERARDAARQQGEAGRIVLRNGVNCVVIMSPANGPSVYYLDNVEFKPVKTKK